jgi:predicted DNA binding CopG/RHH family protein
VPDWERIPYNRISLAQAFFGRARATRRLLPKGTQKIIIPTMSDLKLQPDELELLASYENEEWQSVKNIKEQATQYQVYARATFRKDQRINIRISEKDLLDLQKRALREGIPYQTLISSVLRKYISGALAEK